MTTWRDCDGCGERFQAWGAERFCSSTCKPTPRTAGGRRRRPRRLRYYARRLLRLAENGGTHTPEQWEALKRACGGRCLRCGRRTRLTRDHVVPVSKGGRGDIGNIQPLCWPCNRGKYQNATDYRLRQVSIFPMGGDASPGGRETQPGELSTVEPNGTT